LGDGVANIEDKKDDYLAQNFNDLKFSSKEMIAKVFEGCTFNKCDFSEAMFKRCKFIECHFIKCNLSVAKVGNSRFSDVVFEECKMVGVDWTTANWSSLALGSPIKMHKCIINDSSFFGLDMKGMVLEECKAHDVDFREGNFTEANFSHTDFANSLFNKTNLTGANFQEAVNFSIDVNVNKVIRAKFSRYEAVRLLESLGIELVD